MSYIRNPKTEGSRILCCIPQRGRCPKCCQNCTMECANNYLEPLVLNSPNIPSKALAHGKLVKINDDNDSNIQRALVMEVGMRYEHRFYNTSIPYDLEGFKDPVVLTVNPGDNTDVFFKKLENIPRNLMFVRVRVNAWNVPLVSKAVDFYTERGVPVVLTIVQYHLRQIDKDHRHLYRYLENGYFTLLDDEVRYIHSLYRRKPVYVCNSKLCKDCGTCLREYNRTMSILRRKGL